MARAEELLALIDNAKAVAADAGADDDPLLCMLVQLAFQTRYCRRMNWRCSSACVRAARPPS